MAKKLTDEERAAREAVKKEAEATKATEKAAKALEAKLKADAESQEAENFSNMPDDWHERNKIPKVSKVKRFSNDDIYELITGLKADVDKEMNIRRGEKPVEGVKPENAAQLVGLVQGMNVVIQRYKIYAKPSKAF